LWKVSSRVIHIAELLRKIPVVEAIFLQRIDVEPLNPFSGYFKLRASIKSEKMIDIYERLVNGITVKYAYVLLIGKKAVMRYNNAPHHRQIATFPHHKHVKNQVKPLYEPSIEAFIKEVKEILETIK